MSTATLIEPAVWTMPEKKRTYTQAKIDVAALSLARKAAALKEKTLAEYVSDVVNEMATRDLQTEGAKLAATAPHDIQAGADQVAPRPPKKDRR